MDLFIATLLSWFIILSPIIDVSGFKNYEISYYDVAPEDTVQLDSPQWSPEENALYFVDNYGQKLFRLDGDTNEVTNRSIAYGTSSLIVPVDDYPGYVVVAVRSSLYLLKWGAPEGDFALRQLTTVDLGRPDNTINDGKVDAKGRLWFGTYGKLDFNKPTLVNPDEGTLFFVDYGHYAFPDTKLRPVSISNGIVWSLDYKKMYYIDSPTKKVAVFDFDLEKGNIANQSTLFDFDKNNIPGMPDGMTIDENGNLWVATYNGQRILVIDPKCGELLDQIILPVDQVTSMMWGGPNLTTLFVTSGKLNVENPKPLSGKLFAITGLNIRGVPANKFKFPNAPNY